MGITHIDFHIDDHLVQVGDGMLRIFVNGDTRRKPIELEAKVIARVLRVATEQIDNIDHDYADAL